MPRLAMHLLGSPLVALDGKEIKFRRRKSLALLVYLAVTAQTYSRDALAAFFWPELSQSKARAGLRRVLNELNRQIGQGCLEIGREYIGIHCDLDLLLDLHTFQDLLPNLSTLSPDAEENVSLKMAVDLYRGDFMAGFSLPACPAFDEWQFFRREELRASFSSALERLSQKVAALGDTDAGIAYTRRWVTVDPLHEPAQRELMRQYALSDQRAAALRQFDECCKVLAKDLGVKPQAETKDLHQAILENRLLPTGIQRVRTTRSIQEKPRHNLPADPIPFVGRESVLAEIRNRLEKSTIRLLTLVGPGGSGKTRLALETGARQLEQYKHGVFFISLEPLGAVEAIVPAIAEGVGFAFHEGGSPKQQLLDYLERKCMLLILDNYEHLLEGVTVTTDILKAAPQVKILTTSRARLNVLDEHIFPVSGMDYPADGFETQIASIDSYGAVQLLQQCAERVWPRFTLQADNLESVIHICALVEGMPLGILLATSWLPVLPLPEIAAEIESGLDFLETEMRDIPERQHSMRTVFEYSWNLLDERQRVIFRRLAVFQGGFIREAARQICGASVQDLKTLLDRSMIRREATGRYSMHRLLREYGWEKLNIDLDEFQEVKTRHCTFYSRAMQQWEKEIKSIRLPAALSEMDVELENCRAAWEWAAGEAQLNCLRHSIRALRLYFIGRWRQTEGDSIFQSAVDKLKARVANNTSTKPETSSAECMHVLAALLARQSAFHSEDGDTEKAAKILAECEALLDDPRLCHLNTHPERAFLLEQRANVISRIQPIESIPLVEQSMNLYRELGDRWREAYTCFVLGNKYFIRGDYEKSEKISKRCLEIYRTIGNPRQIALPLRQLAYLYERQGRFNEAEKVLKESISLSRLAGDKHNPTGTLFMFAWMVLTHRKGRFSAAGTIFKNCYDYFLNIGAKEWLPGARYAMILVDLCLGVYDGQHSQIQNELHLTRQMKNYAGLVRLNFVDGLIYLIEGNCDLAGERLRRSFELSKGIFLDSYYETVLVRVLQGATCCRQGDDAEAKNHLAKALRFGIADGSYFSLLYLLPATALYLAGQGEVLRAVELYALAETYPFVAKARFMQDLFRETLSQAAAGIPPQEIAAAQARGQGRDPWKTMKQLLSEMEDQAKAEPE